MMAFEWNAVILGLAIGAVTSALFFAGLGLGMRLALKSAAPVAALMLSAVIRISVLLCVGWFVVGQGGPWSLVGYATAFIIVRLLTTTVARISIPSGGIQ